MLTVIFCGPTPRRIVSDSFLETLKSRQLRVSKYIQTSRQLTQRTSRDDVSNKCGGRVSLVSILVLREKQARGEGNVEGVLPPVSMPPRPSRHSVAVIHFITAPMVVTPRLRSTSPC
ncbi:hypothetical protein J6590_099324 [Homalodisca vitripennis]|nr:hypothetical protein J6590_099324 [Homalodisca vitripennis]